MEYQKSLFATINITRLLAEKQCTYSETENIIEALASWIKQSRKNNEYESIKDWVIDNKKTSVDNDIVVPLNNVTHRH